MFVSEATVPSELADFFWSLVRLSEPHCELEGELLCDDGLRELLSDPVNCIQQFQDLQKSILSLKKYVIIITDSKLTIKYELSLDIQDNISPFVGR